MNEALELCLSKAPADIRNPNNDCLAKVVKEEKLINWINDEAVEHCTPFQFNSHALVQKIRRARADLVELHVNELRWDEIQAPGSVARPDAVLERAKVCGSSFPHRGSLCSLRISWAPIWSLRRTNLPLLL